MNSEQIVRSYYSRIKGLPSTKYLIAGTLLESLMVITRGISVGLEYVISPFIYLAVGLLGYGRMRKLSLFMFNLTALFYLIFSFIPLQPVYAYGVFIPLAGYALLGYLREELTYAILAAQSILPSLVFGVLPLYYVYVVVIIVGFWVYIRLVNEKGVRTVGFKSLDVLRPFLAGLVRKEYKLVDEFMTLLGVKRDVIVPLFKLGDEVLVLPKLHYGLFGEAGSSRFIYDMESECPNCTVFHGPGSHELDAANSAESKRIANMVAGAIKDGEWKRLRFFGIAHWTEGDFVGHTLVFDRVTLTFLRRPGKGIDDLPQDLWNYSYGTGNFIVDTHSETLKVEITCDDAASIKKGLSRLVKGAERPLLFSKKEGKLSKGCEGLCDSRVKVFAISDGVTTIGIVYVYANNSSEDLGLALQDVPGYDQVIVVTPDDHSCTGVAIGELYTPASACDELISMTKQLLIQALNEMRPVEASFAMVNVKDVKLVGPVISNLLQSLNVVGDFVKKTYWVPFVLPFVTLLIIALVQTLLSAHLHYSSTSLFLQVNAGSSCI